MPLRSVELFCDVVSFRSFSKAAEARGLSQPAVSQAMHQLEERLGVQLLDRSKRPFELTAAGEMYYDRCRPLLEKFHAVEDDLQSFRGRVVGRVRVVSIYSVGLLQMKSYLERFHDEFPDVDVRLDYAHPAEVYNRVMRDEADLGIVSFPKDGGEIGCIDWLQQEMLFICAPNHRYAALPRIELSQIHRERFIAFTMDLTIRRATDRLLRKYGVSVQTVQEFDNIENIKRAVEIGLGSAILPWETVRREIEFGTLSGVHLAGVEFFRPLGIVHKRHKHFSAAANKFLDLLHSKTATVPDSEKPIDSAIGGLA